VAGAKGGVPFLEEFRQAGFRDVRILRTMRNGRSQNPKVLSAEYFAEC